MQLYSTYKIKMIAYFYTFNHNNQLIIINKISKIMFGILIVIIDRFLKNIKIKLKWNIYSLRI
jgi:hypothetical protein